MPEPYFPGKKILDANDPNPCSGCSNCCEYVVLEIDKPTTLKDFDQLFWYLLHQDVWVYLDHEGSWNVQFNTPCKKLDDRRCGIYTRRPYVCRGYQVDNCSRYGEGEAEKVLLTCEEDLFRYLAEKRPAMFAKFSKRYNPDLTPEEFLAERTGQSLSIK